VRAYLEKNPLEKKRAGGVAQGVGPEFKPQYCKKKSKQTKIQIRTYTHTQRKQDHNLDT
jgi:hypothetical protein